MLFEGVVVEQGHAQVSGGVLGVGVDSVSISQMEGLIDPEELGDAFVTHTFTQAERDGCPGARRAAEYYAGRFAVKEAVFKAVAPLLDGDTFDLRIVESLHRADGSPYVNVEGSLAEVLERAGVRALHVSVTNEADLATAFVVATG